MGVERGVAADDGPNITPIGDIHTTQGNISSPSHRDDEANGESSETESDARNSSLKNSISSTPVELSSLGRTPGGNLVMLGAYVEPVTAQVTSKEVFQGTALNEEDPDAAREEEEPVVQAILCRRPIFRVFVLSLVFVVLTVSIRVTVGLLLGKKNEASNIPTEPLSNITKPPTPTPTGAPTSARLFEFLTDLVMRLHVPNADRLSQEPNSPQHMAARWMTEVDEYVPTNDNDLLQRYVLVVFYYSTKESSVAWRTGCGFLDPTTHVCEWNCDWKNPARAWLTDVDAHRMGVFCSFNENDDEQNNSTTGAIQRSTIIGLQLINNDLDGTIPAQELSLLSHLAVLNLSFNTLTGFFELSKLPVSLEHVSFVANQFQTILEEKGDEICTTDLCNIGRLVNLKSLRLSIKKEEIDFDSSWMVQQIDVLGMIPSEIGKLTNLELLALEDVVLFGTLPTELGRLTQLTHLALSHNQLTGFVPSQLSYLTALEVLYLESNLNLKGNLEGLCGAAESSNRTTTMDFSSDCLYGKISCTCCQKCCHPWEGCEDMLMLVQEQEQIP